MPDVQLYIVEASSSALYEWLAEGRIDMVLLFNLAETPELEMIPLFSESFYLVGSGNLCNDDSDINFDEIIDFPLALASESSPWRKALDEVAERRGMALRPIVESESMTALKALAITGDSCSILPWTYLRSEVREKLFHARRIVNPDMRGCVSVVSLKNYPLGVTQLKVRDVLVDVTRRIYGLTEGIDAFDLPTRLRRAMPSALLPSPEGRHRRYRQINGF
jgi:LysR family nitrogen assimilation transcriptional regulator